MSAISLYHDLGSLVTREPDYGDSPMPRPVKFRYGNLIQRTRAPFLILQARFRFKQET